MIRKNNKNILANQIMLFILYALVYTHNFPFLSVIFLFIYIFLYNCFVIMEKKLLRIFILLLMVII